MIPSVLLAIAATGVVLNPPPAGAAAASTPKPCCFVHGGYVGVCSVTPAENESCEDILAYLNNPHSAGRTYCNTTRMRGGWSQVPCPPPPDRPGAASSSSRPASPATPGTATGDSARTGATPR
jgi:hypothetical protein